MPVSLEPFIFVQGTRLMHIAFVRIPGDQGNNLSATIRSNNCYDFLKIEEGGGVPEMHHYDSLPMQRTEHSGIFWSILKYKCNECFESNSYC